MPTLIPSFLPEGRNVWLQSENGILGMGPLPTRKQMDADIINAGKETVTLVPGAATFDSVESFAMIRGGHVDVSVLGVSRVTCGWGEQGSSGCASRLWKSAQTAIWPTGSFPESLSRVGRARNQAWSRSTHTSVAVGMGGAMDLVSNPEETKIIVTTDHCDKKGNPKILDKCSLPLTGSRCVSMIITELVSRTLRAMHTSEFAALIEPLSLQAVFEIDRKAGKMTLKELMPGATLEEVKAKTAAKFEIGPDVQENSV
jgi:3-oxoacid CoA-transferase